MTDETYNASERADVKEADKAFRILERQDLDVTRDIMRTTVGRAYMHRKLARCHAFSNPYTPNPHDTAFQCGEMNVGQMFMAEITRACPDEFILMLKEANERDISSDTTRRNRKAGNGNGEDHAGGNFVDYSNEPAGDGSEAVERDN